MPRAYSDDLRVRILESYERHEGEWEELAKRFGVSLGYAKKIRKQQLRYGQKERKAQCRHGPVSRVTEAVEKELRDQVGEQPDATLQELGQRLWQRTHISLSRTRLWEVLLRLELRRKKNSARGRTGQRGGATEKAKLVARGKGHRDPRGWCSSTKAGLTPA